MIVTYSCKYSCKSLTFNQRNSLFQQYYEAANHDKQSTFLLGLIQVINVSRRRHGTYDTPEESRRQSTITYTVPNGSGEHVQVCRKTFSDIFALSHKRVEVLVEKKKMGATTYTDQRGKETKVKKYLPELHQQVRDHIQSFPREENHYSRDKSIKEFLSPDLNLNRMFLAYKKENPNSVVTYKYYSLVFKKDFSNLTFGRPRSDTCSKCDLYQNKIKSIPLTNPERKQEAQKLELHHRKVEKARSTMNTHIESSQTIDSEDNTISIDLEQVLFIPTLTHSDMFYSRQLSCFNFVVHLYDTDDAFMCIWDESITGRGGNEIASCLLKVFSHPNFPKRKNLAMRSDNCIGQNKNKIILMLLIYLVSKGIYEKVEQKFLVSGHSYLTCDRDFTQIEKRNRVVKNYTPENIGKMIAEARYQRPFNVVYMQRKDFKDFQSMADEYLNTTKLQISQVVWIKIE
ncbi:hypothetical protein NQ314_020959 [Rhamnusium bicolor]|uniref:DUF7869 domain-containing protein n=1 Tax=Rhamnusium bicolor TaxID=1586634 RepID=A0AAV8WJD1_9CUCU|nr:hypothetical protein NQ314_020959 [Rhamnusium bicolor]